MNPDAYTLAAQSEEQHWWFAARRDVLRSVLDRFCPRGNDRGVLEAGCGNGGNLPLLADYGSLCAFEIHDEARRRASARGIARVEKGWLPDGVPFGDVRFDLVAALDVLEHVEDDASAVRALRNTLAPAGLLLLTVPAYTWLWSRHDELSHHRRRYSLPQLVSLVEKCGLRTAYASYFNSLLFPAGVAHIKLSGWLGGHPLGALRVPAAPINGLLREVFRLERHLLPRVSLPFGISIVVCARPV
jgi:SAM-dependent methyltransferase